MRKLYEKLKKHGSAAAFLLGFAWDNVMLSRIDHALAHLILSGYLIISALCILLMAMPEGRGVRRYLSERYFSWLGIIVQFSFGSLVSAYIIFYFRSASLASNWPFLLFLVLLVVANERFHRRYAHLTFLLSVFFILLFSYTLFSLPVLLGVMGIGVFILSGIVSALAMALFVRILVWLSPERVAPHVRLLVFWLLLIYAMFNFAYFTNTIPPVPLALKEIGVYHSIVRTGSDSYKLSFEPNSWYPFLGGTSDTFRRSGSSQPIYVWTAVFAPEKFVVPIFHRWQYFDQSDKKWVATDLIKFTVAGGRGEGFRGYSSKSSVFPAKWRVDVETSRRELLGRVEFTVENVAEPLANLVTETR